MTTNGVAATASASQQSGLASQSQNAPSSPTGPNSPSAQRRPTAGPPGQRQGSPGATGPSQQAQQGQQQASQQQQQQQQPAATTRPRDVRTIELLLQSQGVTSYEPRVPLLLLDFAYRHTSSVLSDALHLSSDPYVAGSGEGKGAKGAAKKEDAPAAVNPGVPGDANVSVTAIQLAIASRLAYQFRGGSGGGLQGVVPAVSGIGGGAAGAGAAGAAAGAPGAGGAGGAQGGAQGANAPASQIPGVVTVAPGYAGIATAGASGGISREWLLELARERNKVALPRVPASEWGVRLPSERFVLSGVGWGLKEGQLGDALAEDIGDDEDDEADGDVEMGNGGPSHSSRAPQAAAAAGGDHPMQDVEDDEDEDEDVEGGTMEDVFGQQQDTTMRDGDDAMDDATAANVKTERP